MFQKAPKLSIKYNNQTEFPDTHIVITTKMNRKLNKFIWKAENKVRI